MPTKTKQLENKKIPKLRFPGFSGEWEEKRLGEVTKIIDGDRGLNYPNGEDFSNQGYCLFLNAKNVTKRGFSFDEKSFVTKEKDIQLRKGKLQRNDIILTTRGSVGHVAFYNDQIPFENMRVNSGMVLVRQEKKNIEPKFLYKFLISKKVQNRIQRISFGSAQPQLTVKEIINLKVDFPSLPEQQKIAEFLGAVDEWTENLRKQKGELEAYKKGMMQKIFASSCHSRADGNPASRIRFKDDNGNNFPEWEEKTIGQVLKIGSGKDYKQLGHGNIPVFGTGGYMLSVNKALYSGESVFIGRKGTINKPFYYNGDFWTVDTLFYTYDFSEIIPKFTYLVFQQINWLKYNEASGVPSLSKTTIEKIKINLPYIAEQQIITKYFTAIEDLINSKQQQITQAEEWKKGLMQGLLV